MVRTVAGHQGIRSHIKVLPTGYRARRPGSSWMTLGEALIVEQGHLGPGIVLAPSCYILFVQEPESSLLGVVEQSVLRHPSMTMSKHPGRAGTPACPRLPHSSQLPQCRDPDQLKSSEAGGSPEPLVASPRPLARQEPSPLG